MVREGVPVYMYGQVHCRDILITTVYSTIGLLEPSIYKNLLGIYDTLITMVQETYDNNDTGKCVNT